MISKLTTLLLVLGLLSLVTARPLTSHVEDAKEQDTSLNDVLTDKDLTDFFKSIFPSNNVKEQGRTFEWSKEQGRRVPFPFNKGKTQDTAQNVKKQGLTITLPDGNTFELGEEQGRKIPPPKEQSYTGKNLEEFLNGFFQSSKTAAKEQGISITLPDGNTFELGKEQGRRVGWSHEQGIRVPYGEKQGLSVGWSQGRRIPFGEEQGRRIGWSHEQGIRVPYGEKQGLSVGWSQGRRIPFGEEQGRRIGWSHEQGMRVPYGEKQGLSVGWSQGRRIPFGEEQGRTVPSGEEQGRRIPFGEEQGRRVPSGEEQGRRIPFGEEQGRTVPFGEEQGRRIPFGEEQGRRIPFGEEQGRIIGWGEKQGRRVGWGEQQSWRVPYYGSNIIWSKEQGVKEQSSLNPWLNYRYPYSGFSKEQGIRVPSAKQQSFGYNNQLYAKQQGRRIIPAAKKQGIQFPVPVYYYNSPVSSKDKNVQAAIESIYNTAVVEALCSAASDKEKIAEVAAYAQQNLDDLLNQFQGLSNICDLINGSGANGSTDKDAKSLSKELNELLKDEK